MKRSFLFSFIGLIVTYSLIFYAYAEPVSESRELEPFTRITLEVPADVEITVGEAQSFAISGKQQTLQKIETRVQGGKLIIDNTEKIRWGGDVVISITVPKLSEVKISGRGDFKIKGLNESAFTAKVSGSGKFDVSGRSESLDIVISGSGKGDFTQLQAENVSARISGSGKLSVFAEKVLDAKISGSGEIKYKGKPDLNSSISGNGRVTSLRES